jgi:hypothetical protein
MKVSPVKSYKTPSYPTRSQARKDPGLLKADLPHRWLNGKLVTGAIAAYLLCSLKGDTSAGLKAKPGITLDAERKNDTSQKENRVPSEPVYVAPIFPHGDGVGAFGCIITNPPAYLSEEDARYIIEEELMKEGIVFDRKNVKIDEIIFSPQTDDDPFNTDDSEQGEKKPARPRYGWMSEEKPDTLALDGYSSGLNLAYEFVSGDEYNKMCRDDSHSTVHVYSTVEASEVLRDRLKSIGKMNAVVFYDPLYSPAKEVWEGVYRSAEKADPYDLRPLEKEIKQKDEAYDKGARKEEEHFISFYDKPNNGSKELLRKQVRDFIVWLKKESRQNKPNGSDSTRFSF